MDIRKPIGESSPLCLGPKSLKMKRVKRARWTFVAHLFSLMERTVLFRKSRCLRCLVFYEAMQLYREESSFYGQLSTVLLLPLSLVVRASSKDAKTTLSFVTLIIEFLCLTLQTKIVAEKLQKRAPKHGPKMNKLNTNFRCLFKPPNAIPETALTVS